MKARTVPWILALAGLAIWLVGSGFAVWANVVGWLITLALAWAYVTAYRDPLTRTQRIALGILLLPLLVLGTPGGWWLVPADLAWISLELLDPRPRPQRHRG
jgi:hypothetical protein